MDFAALVEEITRLVCDRLQATAGESGGLLPKPPPTRTTSALVVLGRGAPATLGGFDYDAFANGLTALSRTAPVMFHVVPSSRWPVADLAARLPSGSLVTADPKADWVAASQQHRALYLPNIGVGVLAKLALLIADEPAVEAAVQFLLQNKPVIAGWDDVQMLLAHEGYNGRSVQEVVRSHVRGVQGLGVYLGVGKEPLAQVSALLGAPGIVPLSRSKAVVTESDVYELSKRGQSKVVYPPGSIVTALAWEAASRLGIELTLQ